MFTKIFIYILFALLGITLALANPVTQNDLEVQNGKNWGQNVKEWFDQVGETLKDYHEQSKKSFQDIMTDLNGISGKAVEIGKEKLTKLEEKYDDIREKTKGSIEQKQEDWRPYFEKLKKNGGKALEEWKEKATKYIGQEKERLQIKFRKLKEKITETFEAGAKKWNEKKDE